MSFKVARWSLGLSYAFLAFSAYAEDEGFKRPTSRSSKEVVASNAFEEIVFKTVLETQDVAVDAHLSLINAFITPATLKQAVVNTTDNALLLACRSPELVGRVSAEVVEKYYRYTAGLLGRVLPDDWRLLDPAQIRRAVTEYPRQISLQIAGGDWLNNGAFLVLGTGASAAGVSALATRGDRSSGVLHAAVIEGQLLATAGNAATHLMIRLDANATVPTLRAMGMEVVEVGGKNYALLRGGPLANVAGGLAESSVRVFIFPERFVLRMGQKALNFSATGLHERFVRTRAALAASTNALKSADAFSGDMLRVGSRLPLAATRNFKEAVRAVNRASNRLLDKSTRSVFGRFFNDKAVAELGKSVRGYGFLIKSLGVGASAVASSQSLNLLLSNRDPSKLKSQLLNQAALNKNIREEFGSLARLLDLDKEQTNTFFTKLRDAIAASVAEANGDLSKVQVDVLKLAEESGADPLHVESIRELSATREDADQSGVEGIDREDIAVQLAYSKEVAESLRIQFEACQKAEQKAAAERLKRIHDRLTTRLDTVEANLQYLNKAADITPFEMKLDGL